MSTDNEERRHPIRETMFTWMSFVLAVVSIPTFCFCYLTTSIGRFVLLRVLKSKYPELEFIKSVSIRSAMDTPDNTGYIVVLLKVNGDFDVDLMKHTIQTDIVEKYDRMNGRLCFPHLQCSLTKRWKRYAWTKTSNFTINNHVIELSGKKAVSEDQIMQRVNEIIAEPIPAELPQWRITVIPSKEGDSFYLLVRIHHLYVSEDGVGIGDLLLLRPDDNAHWTPGGVAAAAAAASSSSASASAEQQLQQQNADADTIQNILATVYQAPTALPRLGEHVSEICANTWNELVSTYDPLENPKVFKRRPNVFAFATMVVIATASAARDASTRRNFGHKLRRELARRDIRFRYMCASVAHTFHPAACAAFAWWLLVKCILRLPITALLMAKNTSAYVYWASVLLYSASELLYLARLAYRAPSTVIRELVLPFLGGPEPGDGDGGPRAPAAAAAAVPGAKCVCWSRPIDQDLVSTVHDNTGAATCEIQLSMLAAVLRRYFEEAGVRPPGRRRDVVMTTTRFVSKTNLFQLNNRRVVTNGLLALPLPMDACADPMYGLHKMQECLQEAIGNQTALYIASMWQVDHSLATSFLPSQLVSAALRFLSSKYPLSVTYIEEHRLNRKRRRLLWGQEVDAIMYWRPPQANVCMSLSLINYGGHLRLAVMADSKMAPSCTKIVSMYEKNIPEFITAAENYAKIVNTSD